MISTIQDVLTDPDNFFEGRVSNPRLLPPLTIVIAYIALRIAADLPFMLLIDTDPLLIVSYGTLGLGLTYGIGGLVAWLIYAGAFHGLSYVFGGSGPFRRTFTLVGWGFLPQIAGHLLLFLATVIAVQNAPAISLGASEQMVTVIQQHRDGALFGVVSLASIALTVWSAYIWTFTLKHTRDLSTRQALISVGVPVLLFSPVALLL